jgi:diaminohydroxyphosphoribosylaminopyrimidine deaminase/5-amino-6-(5-phosphoribosylamino)uracil reductase
VFEGFTQPPGQAHAEIVALRAARDAGASTEGATLYSTLEPCSHTGRTGPCTEAIVAAGITHVVVGIEDPDPLVAGSGIQQLHSAGLEVTTGVLADEIQQQLAPYLFHRQTNRPFVVLKMATTLDARTAIPNGPRWITGDKARQRVHQLRAHSDAIVVGATTVLHDDPELTVRHVDGPSPQRIVLSRSTPLPENAKVHPCVVWKDDIESLLKTLGQDGVIQLMVEGGPTIATEFHRRGLINQYVFHIAPIVSGSDTATGVFIGEEQVSLEEYAVMSTMHMDDDLEIVLELQQQKVGTP